MFVDKAIFMMFLQLNAITNWDQYKVTVHRVLQLEEPNYSIWIVSLRRDVAYSNMSKVHDVIFGNLSNPVVLCGVWKADFVGANPRLLEYWWHVCITYKLQMGSFVIVSFL